MLLDRVMMIATYSDVRKEVSQQSLTEPDLQFIHVSVTLTLSQHESCQFPCTLHDSLMKFIVQYLIRLYF